MNEQINHFQAFTRYHLSYVYIFVRSDPSVLSPGEEINNPEELKSVNGKYKLLMQDDGNLVLQTKEGKALWASDTAGKGSAPYRLKLQDHDMHLVIYDKDTTAIFATGTYIEKDNEWKAGGHAKLEDDGNFVVRDGSNKVMWDTGTSGGTKSAKWKSG